MLMLVDFVPSYCPQCGYKLNLSAPVNRNDFLAGASCGCSHCNTMLMGYVPRPDLIEATRKSGSDVPQYAAYCY